MVDYASFMQRPQNNTMGKILGAMAFRENRRKNDMTAELLEKQDKRSTVENEQADMRYKADMTLKAYDMAEKDEEMANTFLRLGGIEGNVSNRQVSIKAFGNTITGSMENMRQLSQFGLDGNVEAAKQFLQNPNNKFMVIPDEPDPIKNFDELLFKTVQSGDMEKANQILGVMGAYKSIGTDTSTPQIKNAIAMGYEPGSEAFQSVLAKMTQKPGAKLTVGPDGTVDFATGEQSEIDNFRRKLEVKAEVADIEKRKELYPKYRNALDDQKVKTALINKTINEAIELATPYTTGFGAWAKVIPASTAKTLHEKLNTIKANVGFDKLQDMRDNSPTGGALGQVSEMENKLLQSVSGSLEQSMETKEIVDNLKEIQLLYKIALEQNENALQQDFFEFIPAGASPNTGAKGPSTAEEYIEQLQRQ